jgi:hypothetical protein
VAERRPRLARETLEPVERHIRETFGLDDAGFQRVAIFLLAHVVVDSRLIARALLQRIEVFTQEWAPRPGTIEVPRKGATMPDRRMPLSERARQWRVGCLTRWRQLASSTDGRGRQVMSPVPPGESRGAPLLRGGGASLALACQSCGFSNEPGEKFCRDCGAPLETPARAVTGSRFSSPESYTLKHLRAALEGERKQVTVLFADMKGSMEVLADPRP